MKIFYIRRMGAQWPIMEVGFCRKEVFNVQTILNFFLVITILSTIDGLAL